MRGTGDKFQGRQHRPFSPQPAWLQRLWEQQQVPLGKDKLHWWGVPVQNFLASVRRQQWQGLNAKTRSGKGTQLGLSWNDSVGVPPSPDAATVAPSRAWKWSGASSNSHGSAKGLLAASDGRCVPSLAPRSARGPAHSAVTASSLDPRPSSLASRLITDN